MERLKGGLVFHQSVLLKESTDWLRIRAGGLYLDATLGDGGHTEAIVRAGGKVLGLDRDPQALVRAKSRLREFGRVQLVEGNFRFLAQLVRKAGGNFLDGIIFDLGLSFIQLSLPERGFSHRREGRLDMRMSPQLPRTAEEIINDFPKRRLYEIFTKFGEERLSHLIADLIAARRSVKRISSTSELYGIIETASEGQHSRQVASRIFQALRIFINDELSNLVEALPQAIEVLKPDGRLVVISYHSLEDRIVKKFFSDWQKRGWGSVLTKQPVRSNRAEIEINRAASSGKLRAFEKVGNEKK